MDRFKDYNNMNFDDRLSRSVASSYRSMKPYRELTEKLVMEYAGPAYTANMTNESRKIQYLNLLQQAVETWLMTIIPNQPQILVSTGHSKFQPFAKHFQLAVNNLLGEINFHETARDWVLDAIFGLGIMKTHMADSGEVMMENDVEMDPGIPFASTVSLDDFVFDASAKRPGLCRFMGDMYRISFDEMVANEDYYNIDVIRQLELKPNSKYSGTNHERVDHISRGVEVDTDELEPMIDVADIYVPSKGMIYTYAVASRDEFKLKGPPIAEMEWEGTEMGPYTMLSFVKVPQNIMPASMTAQVSALSRLVNNLMRKQSRQASNQKTFHIYGSRSQDTAKAVQQANDGDIVKVGEVEDFKEMKTGGPDVNNQAVLNNSIQYFDRMGGNITSMAGLGAQADTAKQEQIISEASSKKEAHMSQFVQNGLTKVIRDLGLMLWTDEFKTISSTENVEGTDYTYDATWYPDEREGQFFDYNFQIDVYSMVQKSPAQRLRGVNEVVGMLSQMYPMLAEQGGTIDMQSYLTIMGELMNEPRLNQIVRFDKAPMLESLAPQTSLSGPSGSKSTMGKPNGNYQRTNISANDTGMDLQQLQQQPEG